MYETTWRDILISAVVTLVQSLVVAALISTVLASISVAAAWTRSDLVFKASMALVVIPQGLAAPLIYMVNHYKRVYILDAIGLLFVPLLIPPTVFKMSQLALAKLLTLQIPSDLGAAIVICGYAYLMIGLWLAIQDFAVYVERPYVRGWRTKWKESSRKRRRW